MAVAKKTVAKKTVAKKTVAKKPTKVQQKALAKTRAMKNPITGGDPNTYTQAEGVSLDDPVAVRAYKPPTDPYIRMTQARARDRSTAYAADRTGRIITEVPGYGSVDLDDVGWTTEGVLNDMGKHLMGFRGNAMSPNVTSGAAINEPHIPHEQAMVGRRAEDLSGLEHRKATAELAARGITEAGAARETTNAYERANMRAILAGASHIAGSGFYGGPSEPNDVMKTVQSKIVDHPGFKGTEDDAWAVTAAANALTSPKSKFEQVYADGRPKAYPNNAAADTAVTHALAKGLPSRVPSAPLGGMHGNTIKAAMAASAMLRDPGDPRRRTIRDIFTWTDAPKTGAYVSAHTKASTPDSYGVSDVHSTRTKAPFLASEKSSRFLVVRKNDGTPEYNSKGDRVTHSFEAEDLGSGGQPAIRTANARLRHYGFTNHRYETLIDANGRPVKGNSPVEEALAKAGAPGHAILDRAGRLSAHSLGKTPSVNHAQAQNQVQEVDWREQQINRPDLPYNSETEYPGGQERMGLSNHFSVADSNTWGIGQQFRGV